MFYNDIEYINSINEHGKNNGKRNYFTHFLTKHIFAQTARA